MKIKDTRVSDHVYSKCTQLDDLYKVTLKSGEVHLNYNKKEYLLGTAIVLLLQVK